MKKVGATRVRVAALVFILVIVAFGASYLLTSPPTVSTGTTTQTASTAATTTSHAISQVSVPSSTQQTSVATSSSSASSVSSLSTPSVTSSLSNSSSRSTSTPQRISHVVVILMENKEYSSVIGNSSAPYQNQLASAYAVAGNYFAVAHPSLPNYLALIAGSTFGVTNDCAPAQCGIPKDASTIAGLLDSHGLSWKDYSESMPTSCSQVDSSAGLYYTKHNPFVYFGTITGNDGSGTTSSYCRSHVVSMDQFWVDLLSGSLPNYSFIAPNECDDAHSCSLSTADQWLSMTVPRIIGSSSFSSTALFIVYDEGTTNESASSGSGGGGQVPLILVSPFAKHGYVSNAAFSQYSLLATVEANFNLGSLGRNDATASVMSDLFINRIP
ncbi:MAG: hypothetical protein OK455_03040 [Thaumarchaeota archaeon]|nr:hypothetical protein [Nitrososphaerota archaeon]